MSDDLSFRRSLLFRHVGERVTIKRQHRQRKDPGTSAELLDVKRSRALVRFDNGEDWWLPIPHLLIPGCVESDPRQLPLLVEV